MRSKMFLCCAVAALVAGAARPAGADVFQFNIMLDSIQAGISGSTGTGMGTAMYDDATGDISWDISFEGLTGTTTNAHFHGPADFGEPANVRLGTPFPSGVMMGTIAGSGNISTAFGDELIAGLWYHNIHTSHAGGGEIRGQVLLIPEPATAGIALVGALGALAMARFRPRRE